MAQSPQNLYVHFPFCRRKCTYCVLHSRVNQSPERRQAYISALCNTLRGQTPAPMGTDPREMGTVPPLQWGQSLSTIYFGGGSPALCDLSPLFDALAPFRTEETEFTVELHPLDVTPTLLETLKKGGVNRISMGVQSLDDAVLKDMGRGYTADEAERAFAAIKSVFPNAGIDLIVGYPHPDAQPLSEGQGKKATQFDRLRCLRRLASWGLTHCSVYSLILEEGSLLAHRIKRGEAAGHPIALPSDDEALDELQKVCHFLEEIGLHRYEISNYAIPGCECRHNLATWRGEDYIGLGDGAHGRIGLTRTHTRLKGDSPSKNGDSPSSNGDSPSLLNGDSPPMIGFEVECEEVTPEQDEVERRIFRLRTHEGLDPSGHPEWLPILDRFTSEGLLEKSTDSPAPIYRLTERGTEVCDTILAELV